MAVTAGRFYFKRLTHGVLTELKDHPLNGSVVAGAGPAVDPVAYNKPKSSSWDRRRNEIQIFVNGKEQTITTAFFEDQPVEVYEWWPNTEARSTYMLVPKVTKSGVFDNDVRAGYYKQSRTTEQEFYADFVKWMQDHGVPELAQDEITPSELSRAINMDRLAVAITRVPRNQMEGSSGPAPKDPRAKEIQAARAPDEPDHD